MKTILLPYHDEVAARSALATAILVAKQFGAYVEGLIVAHDPRLAVGFGPGLFLPPEYLSTAAADWRAMADGARKAFLQVASDNGLPVQEIESAIATPAVGWREIEGIEADVIGHHGRLFDLIVIGRTTAPTTPRWKQTCEAALFESGRPVLVASHDIPSVVGRSIVIVWNGSTESARTVALGMPFLHAAGRVEVLGVKGTMVTGPSADEVATHLRRNGIPATSRILAQDKRPAGEVALDEAGDIGADLIFKGAFTRSRLRQVVFGGTTQHILDFAKMPVLLAH